MRGSSPPALWHEFSSQLLVQQPWAGDRVPAEVRLLLVPSAGPIAELGGADPWGWGAPEPCLPLHAEALLRPLKARASPGECRLRKRGTVV